MSVNNKKWWSLTFGSGDGGGGMSSGSSNSKQSNRRLVQIQMLMITI